MNGLAKEYGVTLGLYAEKPLSDLYDLVKKLEEAGNKNLVLDVTGKTAKETLANAVIVRRTALKDGDRSFGYPSIVNLNRFAKGDSPSADRLCRHVHREVRLHHCHGEHDLRRGTAPVRPASEHLHRSPEAHEGGSQDLSPEWRRREQPSVPSL